MLTSRPSDAAKSLMALSISASKSLYNTVHSTRCSSSGTGGPTHVAVSITASRYWRDMSQAACIARSPSHLSWRSKPRAHNAGEKKDTCRTFYVECLPVLFEEVLQASFRGFGHHAPVHKRYGAHHDRDGLFARIQML